MAKIVTIRQSSRHPHGIDCQKVFACSSKTPNHQSPKGFQNPADHLKKGPSAEVNKITVQRAIKFPRVEESINFFFQTEEVYYCGAIKVHFPTCTRQFTSCNLAESSAIQEANCAGWALQCWNKIRPFRGKQIYSNVYQRGI